MALHLASPWNRGLAQLGNGLMVDLEVSLYLADEHQRSIVKHFGLTCCFNLSQQCIQTYWPVDKHHDAHTAQDNC